MNPQAQQDERDRRDLFDRVVELLTRAAERDSTLLNFDRRPMAFSLRRYGHLLTYAYGPAGTIGEGQIQWCPNPDQDLPHDFRVRRSAPNPERFSLNNGEELDLDGIADRIVREFLGVTDDVKRSE